jgi:magnesium chelatase family protein
LRQPLEEGVLMIARAHGHVRYPARFQLVAAMNPCRCGYFNDQERRCTCTTGDPERYVQRVSGPLLDRIDMQIEMSRVSPRQLLSGRTPETSEAVRHRIVAARAIALARNGGRPNARLTGPVLLESCRLTPGAQSAVQDIAASQHLSARSTHRLMRVARTIADLADRADISEDQVNAAAALREPAAQLSSQLAA